MKRILAAALLLAAPLACTKENHPATPDSSTSGSAATGQAGSTTSDLAPDTVVATLNGQNITAKELDEELKPQLDQLAHKYQDDKFKLREQGLDNFITKKLVDAEAKKENLTEEAWIKKHIEAAAPSATEADAKKFYDENQARMQGAPFDQVKERIIGFLTNEKRQETAGKLIEGLRSQAKVDIKLEEPTVKVDASGPSMGPDNAPVTIVEFSDFQCPFCSRVEPTIKRVLADYPGKVKFVFRDFPLNEIHPYAQKAAEASHCAEAQGKYWPMHDALFAHQDQLDAAGLKKLAKDSGLDDAKFTACLDKGEMKKTVDDNQKAGASVGVGGTPYFFVNGHPLNGAVPYEEFKKTIDKELAKVASK